MAADPDGNPFLPILTEGLARRLAEGAFTHVGLSVNYLSQALTAFALAGHLRRTAPGLRLAMGGGLITSWLARHASFSPLTAPGGPFAGLVDLLVSGPGEAALAAWLGATPVGDTPAAWSYAFDGLPLADYLSPGLVLPFSLAHGCFWATCSFCPETVEAGGYRSLPPSLAVGRVQALVERHSPALVHFLDDAISPAVLRELARKGVGAPWYGFARFDTPLDDPGACRALARQGCVMLQLGLESGDQAVLDALRKGIRLETASRILYNLREVGIGTYVYLLFGTPAENVDAAHRTLRFVADHAGAIDFLNAAIFNLPQAAPEARDLPTRPFSQGDLGLYLEFAHPLGWNRGEVRRFLDTAFRRHPAIAPILRRDPPAFTSSHAPFFLPRP
ncbi:MAG: radical SAM protein [Candidatus Riflebacteria bacterium]|nr:radical SAM protein [Candidatus Riflebacteria bacterium]